MSIEGLEKIRKLYDNEGGRFSEHNRTILINDFMKTTIDTFKEFKKGSDIEIKKLKGSVKALEEQGSHYPAKEEIRVLK